MIAGRKRKFRGTHPTRAAEPREDLRLVVANQPHRRGSHSNRLAEAAGRLIEEPGYLPRGKSRFAAYEAASRLSGAYHHFQTALGSRRPLCNSIAGSDVLDDPERDAAYLKEWADVTRELRWVGHDVEKATVMLCCDQHPEDWRVPFWIRQRFLDGLPTLTRYYGLEYDQEDKEHS